MCSCETPTQPIYGKIELKNGITSKWLLFIDGTLPLAEAEAEAIRIQSAWWKGCVVRCWTTPQPLQAGGNTNVE